MNDYRITVRFKTDNPEHTEIIQVLKNLDRTRYPTISKFVIEVLSDYVKEKKLSDFTTLSGEGLEKRMAEMITSREFEARMKEYDSKIRLFIYDTFMKSSVTGFRQIAEARPAGTEVSHDNFEAESVPIPQSTEENVDEILQSESVMKALSSWTD